MCTTRLAFKGRLKTNQVVHVDLIIITTLIKGITVLARTLFFDQDLMDKNLNFKVTHQSLTREINYFYVKEK